MTHLETIATLQTMKNTFDAKLDAADALRVHAHRIGEEIDVLAASASLVLEDHIILIGNSTL